MKKNNQELIHTLWIVGLFVVIVFVVPNVWSKQFVMGSDTRNVYSDENGKISFKYPEDYQIDQSQNEELTMLDIYPDARSQDAVKPIELFYEIDQNPEMSITDQILQANPQLTKNNLHRLKRGQSEGVQILNIGTSGEKEVFSYLKANGKIYILKFNQRIFSPESPLVLIDNTPFAPIYANILNSIILK